MAMIVPITRRDFVQNVTLALVPLPAAVPVDPVLAESAAALGVDVGAVRWGRGVTLVAPLATSHGAEITVQAHPDDAGQVKDLFLFAPGTARSAALHAPRGDTPALLALPVQVRRSQVVAAVLRGADGGLSGVAADLRMIG